MQRVRKHLVCMTALLCMFAGNAAGLSAADSLTEQQKAQNKLLAYRAARADAIRKLAERINGLLITSQTTVKDFVAESDTIRTAMTSFLSGMKEVSGPNYMEDGTCEVTLEVKINEIITTLKRFHRKYYQGNRIRIEDFDQMTTTNKVKTIRETGAGAPRENFVEDPISPVADGGSLSSLSHMGPAAKEYWMAHCTARGRLMAVRAARVDAFRRLGERIGGVLINSRTTVRDFVAESDQVDMDMRTFVRGAQETGVRYHSRELIVEVELSIKLREVIKTIQNWAETHYRGDRVRKQDFEKVILENRDKVIRETGMGVPPEKYLKNPSPADRAVVGLTAQAPDWISRTLRATGQGAVEQGNRNAAQAKLMAYRAAELDARRKLAEQINGLVITSSTTVSDFVAENDDIRTDLVAFQQGTSVVDGSQQISPDGTAEVMVEIDLRPLWRIITYYQRETTVIKMR